MDDEDKIYGDFKYHRINFIEATQRMRGIGYTEYDAAVAVNEWADALSEEKAE